MQSHAVNLGMEQKYIEDVGKLWHKLGLLHVKVLGETFKRWFFSQGACAKKTKRQQTHIALLEIPTTSIAKIILDFSKINIIKDNIKT